MGPPARPIRWLVLSPITWLVAGALAVVGVALLPVALLVDLVDRQRLRATRLLALGWTFCFLEFLTLPLAFWLWATNPFLAPDARRSRYQRVVAWWLRSTVDAITRTLGFRVEVSFPETGDRSLIVLSRHAGPGDALMLMDILARQGREVRSLGKQVLLWDPIFDHVATGAGYVFLGPGATAADVSARSAMPPRGAFVSFPEGGNFTAQRHDDAIDSLRSRGEDALADSAESLRHLLLPRSGGVHAALVGAPDAALVLVGHAGHEDLTSLRSLWDAIPAGRTVAVEGRLVPRPDGWEDRAVVGDWLLACWRDLDRWIERHEAARTDQGS